MLFWWKGLEETTQPWLKPHVSTPGAADPPLNKTRKRPLIYVHELPSAYNTRMLQVCGWQWHDSWSCPKPAFQGDGLQYGRRLQDYATAL